MFGKVFFIMFLAAASFTAFAQNIPQTVPGIIDESQPIVSLDELLNRSQGLLTSLEDLKNSGLAPTSDEFRRKTIAITDEQKALINSIYYYATNAANSQETAEKMEKLMGIYERIQQTTNGLIETVEPAVPAQ